jgi:hypothetical protein
MGGRDAGAIPDRCDTRANVRGVKPDLIKPDLSQQNSECEGGMISVGAAEVERFRGTPLLARTRQNYARQKK